MSFSSEIYEEINSQKGIKKIIGKILFKCMVSWLERIDAIQFEVKEDKEINQKIKKNVESLRDDFENNYVNLKNDARLDREINQKIEKNVQDLRNDFENNCVNLRNNNARLDKIESIIDLHGVKLRKIEKGHYSSEKVTVKATKGNELSEKDSDIQAYQTDAYSGIDYFEFENYFRGSRNQIKESQRIYLEYYRNRKHVVDLGCGRGEFLELLHEENIGGIGVDLYEEFTELCSEKGLEVICGDAIQELERMDKVDGIFAGQVVEHLPVEQIMRLCQVAYEKLEKGAFLIVETPNPTSLAIYTHAFYMDPSHQKPIHPMTLKYIAEKAGFENIEILYTESSRIPIEIPELKGEKNFNEAMKIVQDTLFGSQDYALIARK